MAYPFTPTGGEHQVVLAGAASPASSAQCSASTKLQEQPHGSHRPSTGTPTAASAFNLAYRRELFFEAKGFSRSLNLHNGDDDIFINQIADRDNCAVVLTANAGMDVNFQRPADAYRELRLRHCFTERRLPKGSRRLMGSGTLALWLWVAAVAVGVTVLVAQTGIPLASSPQRFRCSGYR